MAMLHDHGQNGVKFHIAHTKILPSNAIVHTKISRRRQIKDYTPFTVLFGHTLNRWININSGKSGFA